MREIVLDTETTGLNPLSGDRIVEIGGVEIVNHIRTGATFHVYLNPDRLMPAEAFAVHGLSDAFLADKPRFADVAADLAAFLGDAPVVAHNAAFDIAFLDAELGRVGLPPVGIARAVDTLALARRKHPGARHSLDDLCARYGIDNSRRTKHGALLDAEILAEVYLELLGGRQAALGLVTVGMAVPGSARAKAPLARRPPPPRLTEEEIARHAAFVATLGPQALWRAYIEVDGPPPAG